MEYPIIKTNILNMVCNKMQQATNQLMQKEPTTVRDKITTMIRHFCIDDKGEKHIKIKMETIADMIGETRLNVSNVLKKMNNEKLITQQRNGFTIIDMQKLLHNRV
jgi:CRP-like cAMP-binding protein